MKLLILDEETLMADVKECTRQGHFQQVAYSTHMGVFTQVCFECRVVRTTCKEAGRE